MPFLQQISAILAGELHDFIELNATEAAAPIEGDGIKSNFGHLFLASGVDMRWLAAVQRDEEKTIGLYAKYRWHSYYPMIA